MLDPWIVEYEHLETVLSIEATPSGYGRNFSLTPVLALLLGLKV